MAVLVEFPCRLILYNDLHMAICVQYIWTSHVHAITHWITLHRQKNGI